MAQLERPQRHGDGETSLTPEHKKLTVNPTMEHYLRGSELSRSSPTSLSSPSGNHDAEEDHNPHPKKFITKMKERAKKLKHSLSNKKKHHEGDSHETDNTRPSWDLNLHEYEEEEEDAEYLGAPMYESEMAPEKYKETAKMHPRATPVVSEKHVLQSSVHQSSEHDNEKPHSPNKVVTESVITKLPNEIFTGIVLTRPVRSNETETETIVTKTRSPNNRVTETMVTRPLSPNTVTETEVTKTPTPTRSNTVTESEVTKTPTPRKTIAETVTEKLGTGYATVSEKLGTSYATVSEKLGTGYTAASAKLGTGYAAASDRLGTGYAAASDKVGPAYATVSDATHAIASKIESLTVSPPVPTKIASHTASPPYPTKIEGLTVTAPPPSQSITGRESTQALSASAVSHNSPLASPGVLQPLSAPAAPEKNAGASEQMWDKGVSVKEYLYQKFEPGEDDRALSQVISDAISPRKHRGEAGVVEKVKGAITSFLRNDESPKATNSQSPTTSSPRIPISTYAYEADADENRGRILQTN